MIGVIKKCGLFGALFAVLSIGLSIGFSGNANAWQGSLPLCTNYPEITDWITSHENYSPEHTGWIAFERDWYGVPFGGLPALIVQWNTDGTVSEDNKIRIDGEAGYSSIGVNDAIGYSIEVNPITGNALFTERVSWTGNTGGGYTDVNCIEQFNNLKFTESYIDMGGDLYHDRNQGSGGGQGAIRHKPNITWSVNDKDVIVYSDDAKNTAVLEDYQIYWFISNTTFDTRQPTEPFALSGCTPPDYNNNFTVPIYFDYGVQAYYADEDCNILQVDDEGNRLSDNMEVLTIDGSTFDGSTTDHEAIIGEIEENEILKAIRKFRPNDGGLAGLIYAPIEAVATLPTIVGSCSPITLPLLGENVSLKCIRPTIQASPMGAVYNTISIIITGIVTWWVAWRTFGTIKNIQDPQDDRVEVLKL